MPRTQRLRRGRQSDRTSQVVAAVRCSAGVCLTTALRYGDGLDYQPVLAASPSTKILMLTRDQDMRRPVGRCPGASGYLCKRRLGALLISIRRAGRKTSVTVRVATAPAPPLDAEAPRLPATSPTGGGGLAMLWRHSSARWPATGFSSRRYAPRHSCDQARVHSRLEPLLACGSLIRARPEPG